VGASLEALDEGLAVTFGVSVRAGEMLSCGSGASGWMLVGTLAGRLVPGSVDCFGFAVRVGALLSNGAALAAGGTLTFVFGSVDCFGFAVRAGTLLSNDAPVTACGSLTLVSTGTLVLAGATAAVSSASPAVDPSGLPDAVRSSPADPANATGGKLVFVSAPVDRFRFPVPGIDRPSSVPLELLARWTTCVNATPVDCGATVSGQDVPALPCSGTTPVVCVRPKPSELVSPLKNSLANGAESPSVDAGIAGSTGRAGAAARATETMVTPAEMQIESQDAPPFFSTR
jgi:hypothetical protein